MSKLNGFQRRGLPPFVLPAMAVCIWSLVAVTFTQPGRFGVEYASKADWLALAKIGSRGLAALLLAWLTAKLWSQPRRPQVLRAFVPLLAFAAWSLLSVAWSARPALSLAQAGCLLILVVLAAVVALAVQRPRDLSFVVGHLCASLAAVSGVIVASSALLPDWGGLQRTDAAVGTGGILHPTTAASSASLGILILLAARFGWGWSWSKWLFWPAMAAHGCVMYMSASRLALAMTAVSAAALVVLLAPRMKLISCVLACSMLATAFLVLDPGLREADRLTDAVERYVDRGQSGRQLAGFSGRDEIWPIVWRSFLDSPWIGHGYYVTSARGEFHAWQVSGNFSAHNLGLQALVTTGMIGLALLVWGLGRPIVACLATPSQNRGDRTMLRLLICLWLWFAGWSLLNVSFLAPYQPESATFFVALGLAFARVTRAALYDDSLSNEF